MLFLIRLLQYNVAAALCRRRHGVVQHRPRLIHPNVSYLSGEKYFRHGLRAGGIDWAAAS